MRGLFYNDGKLFTDKNLTTLVSFDNPTYEIIKRIRIPPHLTDVIVYEQTYEQSLTRLIFVGSDSKGRRQYFYGKLHVKNRNSNRNKIFIKVFNVINKINEFIDSNIINEKDKNDVLFQSGVFMLMETSFFIRMGKMCYLKENETVGLLTLKNKHISISNGKIIIKFIGKDKVPHTFIVHKSNKLYKPLLKLFDKEFPDNFLFSKLSEQKIYKLMKKFKIRLKDLRTYGVNYTFLYNFWSNVKSLNPIPSTKKLISTSIKQTAEIVGHSPSISKSAYIATTVIDFLIQDSNILETIKEKSFEEFIELIVDYIVNRDTI
ncbi:topoisomerase type IB [Goatpox virus]|uniref:DNA topoisomerase n=1 Tax=Goatpox virus TaxID=186805 RepID=A0A5C0PT64_9POXV|nr:topoisomerase type IB [Goatpox virus]QEJ79375.1 topoisomerase type IB [Goatpox virus]QEJ79525.1 topoisomerase type IB [Goatpox virus]